MTSTSIYSISTDIFYIYKITNTITSECYIGFTKDCDQRRKDHFSKNNKKSTKLLYQAMTKFGQENFLFEIIYCSKDRDHTLNEMENYFINEHNSRSNQHGYNRVPGGSSPKFKYETNLGKISIIKSTQQKYIMPHQLDSYEQLGWTRGTAESRNKNISRTRKSYQIKNTVCCIDILTKVEVLMTKSEYAEAKAAGTHIAKNFGMKNSEETKLRKSKSFKGRSKSEEHRKKLSEAVTKQHRILVTSLYNCKTYDIGNWVQHKTRMESNGTQFTYFELESVCLTG